MSAQSVWSADTHTYLRMYEHGPHSRILIVSALFSTRRSPHPRNLFIANCKFFFCDARETTRRSTPTSQRSTNNTNEKNGQQQKIALRQAKSANAFLAVPTDSGARILNDRNANAVAALQRTSVRPAPAPAQPGPAEKTAHPEHPHHVTESGGQRQRSTIVKLK